MDDAGKPGPVVTDHDLEPRVIAAEGNPRTMSVPGMMAEPGDSSRVAGVCLLVIAGALCASGCLRDRISREAPEIVYRRYCASCHGLEGRGDGPAAAALSPPPTDLTRLTYNVDELMSRIDGTETIRAHGDSRMPVWGEVFAKGLVGENAPDRRARLHVKAAAMYARSLQRPAR